MLNFHKAIIVASLFALHPVCSMAAQPLTAQIEAAALAELDKQMAASGLVDPQFELAVVTTRAAPPCAEPVAIEALDTRTPQRMRFLARCGANPGWRFEYVVRARVSALVVVAAAPAAANEVLHEAQLTVERRDVSNIADPVAAPAQAAGQTARRTLRSGDILRSSQLARPILVRRGDAVRMVARRDGIEASAAGEALDAGAEGASVRVKNAGSGQVVRMRVSGAGTVETIGSISP
jgi:flagella basal body P-ring formation protein FlgA